MRLPDFGREVVLCERGLDARYQVAAIGFIVRMLELAAAAFRVVAARRFLVVRPESQRSVVEHCVARNSERHVAPAGRNSVASRRDADDQLAHSAAMASGMASARSSAII